MAKKDMSWYMILQFIGSLIFLYVVWQWWQAGFGASSWLQTTGSGGFWLPIFGAVAIYATIALFILSLVSLFGMNSSDMAMWASKMTMWGGIALFGLTAGGAWFTATILGFVLAYIGAGGQKM